MPECANCHRMMPSAEVTFRRHRTVGATCKDRAACDKRRDINKADGGSQARLDLAGALAATRAHPPSHT